MEKGAEEQAVALINRKSARRQGQSKGDLKDKQSVHTRPCYAGTVLVLAILVIIITIITSFIFHCILLFLRNEWLYLSRSIRVLCSKSIQNRTPYSREYNEYRAIGFAFEHWVGEGVLFYNEGRKSSIVVRQVIERNGSEKSRLSNDGVCCYHF
jgi:hypothetical protein